MRRLFNKQQIQEIADRANLGPVHFQFNTALNTLRAFEVGYIRDGEGGRDLFCKRKSDSTPSDFYLCNDFARLGEPTATEGEQP